MLSAIFKACTALLPRCSSQTANRNLHCLTFNIDGMRFGIDIRMVNRIVRYGIPAVPRDTPAFVRGFLRHEGVMVPILDIADRYGKRPQKLGGRTCLVVVELGHGRWRSEVGVMVEEVFSVVTYRAKEVCAVPDVAQELLQVGVVGGMLQQEENYLLLLDGMHLLPDAELDALRTYKQQTWPSAK